MAVLRRIGDLAGMLLQARLANRENDRRSQRDAEEQRFTNLLQQLAQRQTNDMNAELTRTTNELTRLREDPAYANRLESSGVADIAGRPIEDFLPTESQKSAPVSKAIAETSEIEKLMNPQDVLNTRRGQGRIGGRIEPLDPNGPKHMSQDVEGKWHWQHDQQPDTQGLADIASLMKQRADKEHQLRAEMGMADVREVENKFNQAQATAEGQGAGQRNAWLNGGRDTKREDGRDDTDERWRLERGLNPILADRERDKLDVARKDQQASQGRTDTASLRAELDKLNPTTQISRFKSTFGWPSVTDPGSLPAAIGMPTMPGSQRAGGEEILGRIKAMLTIENLPKMKGYGQLSDGDRAFLEKLGTTLTTRMPEDLARDEINRLYQVLDKMDIAAAAEDNPSSLRLQISKQPRRR